MKRSKYMHRFAEKVRIQRILKPKSTVFNLANLHPIRDRG